MPVQSQFVVGCHIDLFDQPEHRGNMRRLPGPAVYRGLRDRESHRAPRSRSRGAGVQIESLIAGPAAYVFCFEDRAIGDGGVWLGPGQSVGDLRAAGIRSRFDSFQLLTHAPAESDPGFASYEEPHSSQRPRPRGRKR